MQDRQPGGVARLALLDELLELFVEEVRENGGPVIDLAGLKLHFALHGAMTGFNYLLDLPAKVIFRLPEEAVEADGPLDPVFEESEAARCELNAVTVFLNFCETHDLGASLDAMLAVNAGT